MASVPQDWREEKIQSPVHGNNTQQNSNTSASSSLLNHPVAVRAGMLGVLLSAIAGGLGLKHRDKVQEFIHTIQSAANCASEERGWIGKPLILREPLPDFPGCEIQITMEHSLPPSAIGFDEDGMPAQVGKVEPMCLINIMRPDAPVNQKVVHPLGIISGAKSPQHLLNESLDSAVLPIIERIAGEHGEGNHLRSVAEMVEYAQKNRKTLTGKERQEILQQVLQHWLLVNEQKKNTDAPAGDSLTSLK